MKLDKSSSGVIKKNRIIPISKIEGKISSLTREITSIPLRTAEAVTIAIDILIINIGVSLKKIPFKIAVSSLIMTALTDIKNII